MGQAQTSSFVSPFAAPPLMLNTDDLVRNWMTDGNNDTRYHYHGQSRSERRRCRSDGAKASSTSPPVDNGVTGVMVQCGPQIESQKHKLLSTSPAFIFMMIRHQNGEEVILSREAVHGATSRLTYSRHQKDIVLVLSDHPAVHLPARAIATKAGMGEMLFVREGRSRARDRSTEKRICKPMHSMTLLARPGGRSHDFLCGFQNIIATVLSSVQLQAVLPRVASDWEAHLALVLVNVACWHRDLPGLTLLFLGMLLVAEAFRWHTIEIVLGEGGRDRQLLRAVPWDWEVNIGRCLMRWRRVSCASPRISKARPAITTRSVMKEEEMAVFGETQVILEEMIDLEETVEQVAMSEEELAVTVIPSGNSVALSEVSAQETDRSIYGSQRQASDTVIAAEHRPRSTDATAATVHEVEEAEVSACPFACPLEYSEKNPSSSEIAAPRRRSIENISITSTGVRRPPLPLRYLTVTGNNVAKAQAKWAATLRWRAAYGADTILEAPHTNYGLIKKQFPQFVAGRSRSGNPVYYEMSTRIDARALTSQGVDVDEMIRHYVWTNEYIYSRWVPDPEGQIISVVDLSGLSIGGMSTLSLEFVSKALTLIGAHYPARAQAILIVNAPIFFSYIWNLVKGAADEYTSKSLKVYSRDESFAALCEYIEPAQIPVEYGGTLKYGASRGMNEERKHERQHSVRWTSPFEKEMEAHANRIIESTKCGIMGSNDDEKKIERRSVAGGT